MEGRGQSSVTRLSSSSYLTGSSMASPSRMDASRANTSPGVTGSKTGTADMSGSTWFKVGVVGLGLVLGLGLGLGLGLDMSGSTVCQCDSRGVPSAPRDSTTLASSSSRRGHMPTPLSDVATSAETW